MTEQHTDKCCYWDDPEFCDCGSREIDRLTSQLTSAKEKIARLTADNCKPAEEVCELCQPLTDMQKQLEAAKEEIERLNEKLAMKRQTAKRNWEMYQSERKETERRRDALQEFVANAYERSHGMSDFVVTSCEALELAKAALQSRQGEE